MERVGLISTWLFRFSKYCRAVCSMLSMPLSAACWWVSGGEDILTSLRLGDCFGFCSKSGYCRYLVVRMRLSGGSAMGFAVSGITICLFGVTMIFIFSSGFFCAMELFWLGSVDYVTT